MKVLYFYRIKSNEGVWLKSSITNDFDNKTTNGVLLKKGRKIEKDMSD